MPDNRSSALLEIAACAVKTRRDLHRLPELDMIEFRTASIVAERLMALGLEIKLGREVMDATCRRMRCCVRRWEPGVASARRLRMRSAEGPHGGPAPAGDVRRRRAAFGC